LTAAAAPTSLSSDKRVAATYKWFHTIVLGEKLCPFAPPLSRNPELLRVVSLPNCTKQQAIELVSRQVDELVGQGEDPIHETTLVVLDSPFLVDFRDFVRFSWELQEVAVGEAHVDKLQLVLFHPQATHQTYGEESSSSDYTIRSPYPTVHLLREADVMRAVKSGYPNLDSLPARNKEKFIKQGLEVCQQRLQECHKVDV
jgi:hypothetical protein